LAEEVSKGGTWKQIGERLGYTGDVEVLARHWNRVRGEDGPTLQQRRRLQHDLLLERLEGCSWKATHRQYYSDMTFQNFTKQVEAAQRYRLRQAQIQAERQAELSRP
jgi:hypothetical protein